MRDATGRRGGPRHRARPERASLRTLLGAACGVAGVTVLAVGLSGGSLALWADTTMLSASPIQSGTTGLTITHAITPSLWGNLIPGESVRQAVTVTNTGTTPLALSATATSSAAGYEVRLASGTCGASALAGTAATAASTSLGPIAAGVSRTLCLEVRLTSAASAGSTSTLGVLVSGVQS